jgi:hypothetical protein
VWRAADRLGIDVGAATPAMEAASPSSTPASGSGTAWPAPAAYRPASVVERQAAHRALAEVTDQKQDPNRRA